MCTVQTLRDSVRYCFLFVQFVSLLVHLHADAEFSDAHKRFQLTMQTIALKEVQSTGDNFMIAGY